MQKLHPNIAKEKMEKEKICFVDVRTQDEFKSGHPTGAICIPLDEIEKNPLLVPKDQFVILSCQSGKRSNRAMELLKNNGYSNLAEIDGGFLAWNAAGLPINKLRNTIPIMRQVLLTAGVLVFMGSMLTIFLDPLFVLLPLFVGAGLTFAGATGWCGMAFLLERMPWNRT